MKVSIRIRRSYAQAWYVETVHEKSTQGSRVTKPPSCWMAIGWIDFTQSWTSGPGIDPASFWFSHTMNTRTTANFKLSSTARGKTKLTRVRISQDSSFSSFQKIWMHPQSRGMQIMRLWKHFVSQSSSRNNKAKKREKVWIGK